MNTLKLTFSLFILLLIVSCATPQSSPTESDHIRITLALDTIYTEEWDLLIIKQGNTLSFCKIRADRRLLSRVFTVDMKITIMSSLICIVHNNPLSSR
jgi:hypothetical protein